MKYYNCQHSPASQQPIKSFYKHSIKIRQESVFWKFVESCGDMLNK